MVSGFLSGGMAEGMQQRDKISLAEQSQAQDVGLRTRALDLQEKTLNRSAAQDNIKLVDERISDTMTQISARIKAGLEVNAPRESILKSVTPLLETIKPLAAKVGRDPATLDAQIQMALSAPGGVEAATGAGIAAGTKEAAKEKTLTELLGGETGAIRDPAKRVEVEGKLADDFARDSKNFVAVRDAKNSFDSIDASKHGGAADLALVYNFYKMLEPAGRVTDAEFTIAGNIAGLPGAVERFRNQIFGVGNLSDAARKELKGQAEASYQKHAFQHDKLQTQYAEKAKRYGLNPRNVVIDLMPPGAEMNVTPGGTKFRIIQ